MMLPPLQVFLPLLPLLRLISATTLEVSTGTCAPVTWTNSNTNTAHPAPTPWTPDRPSQSWANVGKAKPGEINCRYPGSSGEEVDHTTCAKLASYYGITLEKFFMLNPELDKDCGNVEAGVDYCVTGFIEPLRAFDGKCGPSNKDATCLGTKKQCCNAETWTCGDSPEDCAPGTCFEGACAGDKLYSTDGTCGNRASDNYTRLCAGKWGDCCSMKGKCGTGPEFCSICTCQMGNCERPVFEYSQPLWNMGNTTDGKCGGNENITCNVVYGNCCSKDGVCGSDDEHCGEGCQDRFSRFGTCTDQPDIMEQLRRERMEEREYQALEKQNWEECAISMSLTRPATSTSMTTSQLAITASALAEALNRDL